MRGGKTSPTSCLLHHNVDLVSILHFECVGGVVLFYPLTVKNEAALIVAQALSLAVRVHQLLQLRRLLYLEEDLSPILRLNLDVQLLSSSAWGCFCGGCLFLV